MEIVLYTDKECRDVLTEMKKKPECIRIMSFTDYGNISDDQNTPGTNAFIHSQVVYPDAKGTPVNEYWELDGETGIGSRLSARHMARIISYMKENGGYTIVQTQELGNCLYASVLRGTDIRREFTSMHLRRMLVMLISKHPHFFFEFLKVPLAKHYGHDSDPPEEVDRQEAAGECTAAYARDQRLPGPFNLTTLCEHLLKNGTWGDDLILTHISCMWQIRITNVNATTLGETRVRNNLPLEKADLVLIFAMGDHFMGTGEYYLLSINFQLGDQ